jgi:hypothetical protein
MPLIANILSVQACILLFKENQFTDVNETRMNTAKKKKVDAKDSLTSSTSHEPPYSTFVPKNLTEKSIQILD